MNQLRSPKFWRFVPEFSNGELCGGVYMAREVLHIKNEELFKIFKNGCRLATLEELKNSQTPFSTEGYFRDKIFPQPYGLTQFFHANRFYIEKGVGVNGINWGNHPDGKWAVVTDGNITLRQGASSNVDAFKDFVDENGKMYIPNKLWAECIKESINKKIDDKPDPARFAGYMAGKELEWNEAYLIVKNVPKKHIMLFKKIFEVQGKKLWADGGIPIFGVPHVAVANRKSKTKKIIVNFGAGGACSHCNRFEVTTAKTAAADMRAYVSEEFLGNLFEGVTHLQIEIFPEYKGWRENGYSDTILSESLKMLR